MNISLSAFDHKISGVLPYELSNFLIHKNFGEHYLIQKKASAPVSELKFKRFGSLCISELSYGSEVQLKIPPMGDFYHLQILLAGSCVLHSQGRQIVLSAGDSIIHAPNAEYSTIYSADCKKLIVKIPKDFLQQTAREFGYLTSQEPIRFDSTPLVFPASGPAFNLLNDILSQDSQRHCERVALYYAKLLGNAILDTYDNNLDHSDSLSGSHHRHIEQIRDHVLENLTTDIPVADLARLCRISRKSLYNLFERETGLTPSAYIRRLKLETIHAELSRNLRVRNVTEVALKYGFTNLGRFSAQYREHIGELPSETLRRLSR
ncbi:Transcriptional regulator, AraC family [Marinobacterium lacunae]|uniref:Transcriptional regulator, AraC family n=1 Tax=Marinobacterium lacunae TaxID=1232683 RepID=A0A081FUV5_9GAMM|nr:AraC family transcriptional regulator [Marinobacterium lacunae]KEA62310.1 Transcriptional regulator, AraC family [Marinobacterium lacunae]